MWASDRSFILHGTIYRGYECSICVCFCLLKYQWEYFGDWCIPRPISASGLDVLLLFPKIFLSNLGSDQTRFDRIPSGPYEIPPKFRRSDWIPWEYCRKSGDGITLGPIALQISSNPSIASLWHPAINPNNLWVESCTNKMNYSVYSNNKKQAGCYLATPDHKSIKIWKKSNFFLLPKSNNLLLF